ncbi:MAG: BatA domain-containing protein [Planctomycetes bacterium]|nr:BatA domain-containing protein [Planctomycetota bacterium]
MAISFEFPSLLYALLLLPLLAILQLILPRARRVTVSSLAFWQDVRAESAAASTSRFRRLDLAALLLLALLAALILALSGPSLTRQEETGVACTLVIDVSPSLLMTDRTSETRLARLRRRADELLASLPPDTPVAIVTVPDTPDQPALEGPVAEIRSQTLDRFKATDMPLTAQRLRNRVLLLQSRTQAPVVLLTDVSPYDADSPQPPLVSLLATGADARNLALTAASVVHRDDEAFAMLSASVPDGLDTTARVALSGADMPAYNIDLPLKKGRHTWTFPVPRALPDRITLALDAADDFAADNRMNLLRIEGRRYRLAYVGRPDAALLAMLAAAGADVYEADQSPDTWPEDLDLGLFVDRLPPSDFRHPAVIVNPPSSFGPLVRTQDVRRQVTTWRVTAPSDPLAAHLPSTGPAVAVVPIFRLQPQAAVVIATEQGDPLVARFVQGEAARVAVLFDVDRGNTTWPDEVSFVLFWDNCLSSLVTGSPSSIRYVPVTPSEAALGEVEGCQTKAAAIDESEQARAAVKGHLRRRAGQRMPLWPGFVLAAVGLLMFRTKVMR